MAETNEARFVPEVLRIEGAFGKKLRKAVESKGGREKGLALLAKTVDSGRMPAWLVVSSGTPEQLVHLEPPLFVATSADEDEFYHEPGSAQVVLDAKGRTTRVSANGDASSVRLESDATSQVTAFDAGGTVLRDIVWLEEPAGTLGNMKKLLAQGIEALRGDLTAYELPVAASAAPIPPRSGANDCFLGGPERRGLYDVGIARKQPKLVWQCSADNEGSENGGNPVFSGGLIFAATTSMNARCSATDTQGKSVWATELSKTRTWIIGSACVDNDVNTLYAVDVWSGEVLWTEVLGILSYYCTPAVLPDGAIVVQSDGLRVLRC